MTSDVTSVVTSSVCGTVGVMSADDNQYRVYCETPIEGRYVVIFNSQPVEMKLCEVMVNAGEYYVLDRGGGGGSGYMHKN